MSRSTLFDAKISRPELPEVYVRRRLIRTLQPAPGQGATFVTAPAGYGKTTLLASYLEALDQPSIWYLWTIAMPIPPASSTFLG